MVKAVCMEAPATKEELTKHRIEFRIWKEREKIQFQIFSKENGGVITSSTSCSEGNHNDWHVRSASADSDAIIHSKLHMQVIQQVQPLTTMMRS